MKKIIELNKPNFDEKFMVKYSEFFNFLNKKIDSFDIINTDIQSLFVCLIFDAGLYNITRPESVICRFSKSIEISKEMDIKISLLRFQLDSLLNDYKYDSFKIILFFNIPEDEILSKYLIAKKIKENDVSNNDDPVLNVVPIKPIYSLKQMILNPLTYDEINKIIIMIKNIDKIYNEWGFSEIDSVPKCIVNFFGPPGTGKTMAAHAVANELSLNILALNYADIESKFVGDAPKNLVSAFKIAEKEKAMLFFDEADSFLGKRITNVSSSSDQAVNSLRSQMLILLESFNGTVIFATNLHKNYDSAFESRILKHIKFELPDLDMRAKIIKRMIPNKAPIDMNLLTDDYLLELSEILDGFSPREIKNTILDLLISFLYSGYKEISKELVDKVFRTSKEKFDEIKNKTGLSAEAKKKLENTIKDNLDNKNYTVEKLKENSEEESNDD